MYGYILDFVDWSLVALLGASVIILLYKIFYHIYALMPTQKFPEAKTNHKYAILVPARNESSVIRGLLDSIKAQDYPKELFDTYVIIENENDPTYQICKEYENVEVFIRPNLDVKSKGGALDQVLKYIIESGKLEQKGYEAFFIFDADNIAAPNFLTEMNKTFDAGYEIAISYRNSKNWNDGWVASCSALVFSMLNTFQNKCRSRFTQNVLVSGTGFYITARVIKELGGWPFQTLTEDYEITNYAILNNLKGAYNENTQTYDENPTTLKVSWNQRIRWCKGHTQVTKKYSKKLLKSSLYSKENRWGKFEFGINVIPIIIPIATVIVYTLFTLIWGVVGVVSKQPEHLWKLAFVNSFWALFGIYVFLLIYTTILILVERKHINITFGNAIKTILLNPIFMALFIPIFVAAIFKKDVGWKPITRNVDIQKQKHAN